MPKGYIRTPRVIKRPEIFTALKEMKKVVEANKFIKYKGKPSKDPQEVMKRGEIFKACCELRGMRLYVPFSYVITDERFDSPITINWNQKKDNPRQWWEIQVKFQQAIYIPSVVKGEKVKEITDFEQIPSQAPAIVVDIIYDNLQNFIEAFARYISEFKKITTNQLAQ